MSKKFEIVRPKSLVNSDYEEFEYLIRWIGSDGSDYLYMFYDAEFERTIEGQTINDDIQGDITTLISSVTRSVKFHADDLSLNDYKIIIQLIQSRFVTRLFKDGTTERMAPDPSTFRYRQRDGRYSINFELKRTQLAKWN